MISSNIYQTKMRTDLGQWLCQSSFCLWARRGAAGAAFGRVWDPPLQKTKPFRVCRRGRTLAGPPGNGRRLGRAAPCAAPTKKRERSEISVGAGPRPARGRPHGAAPTGSSSLKERLSGDRKGRPYGGKRTWDIGSTNSGADIELNQSQFSSCSGPQWGRTEPGSSTSDFARRKCSAHFKG